jgi:Phage integrase, N-terminal SAM-like domain
LRVNDVNERGTRYVVRRVQLPASGIASFTVIGPDLRPVELVDEYLAWLTDCERSPNTVEAYAHDLRAFWKCLAERELSWDVPARSVARGDRARARPRPRAGT